MTTGIDYLMENADESLRLDLKTRDADIQVQALWAGIRPGMRVADIGCGPGRTTAYLHRMVQPGGSCVGLDGSRERIQYARDHYTSEGIRFCCRDFLGPLQDLGQFDFIWIRFVLEYFRTRGRDIVQQIAGLLKPGGILCLIDLDLNCLRHYGIPENLEKTIQGIVKALEERSDFDPYAGVKLYSYLYDAGLADIKVNMSAHHLYFGQPNATDSYDWTHKVKVAAKNSGYDFSAYDGGYEKFYADVKRAFSDPRRFTYSPLIWARGCRPS